MNEILKAIENLRNDLSKRIDLLEAAQFKENTLLIKEIYETVKQNKDEIMET